MRRAVLFAIGIVLGLAIAIIVFAAALVSLVRPTPGGWTHGARIGPWHGEVSVPAVMRMATHPVVMRMLQGRDWHTNQGTLRIEPTAQPDSWVVTCTDCRAELASRDAVILKRVVLTAQRQAQGEWRGDFALGGASHAVRGRFDFRFDDRGGELKLQLTDTPLADVYRLFADVIPEVRHAQIDGRVRLVANVKLPQRDVVVEPFIEGFGVAGLGTERLLNSSSACPAPSRGFGTWLPRAVIAAEDQRFQEHSGYDIREITAALSQRDAIEGTPRGASTITQQVAKLLYTGDSRTGLRKLRELLYAVEMDRTLGKARVLNLYLSIAPWGNRLCGAAAASQHYLHKRVDKLTPMEAAWLASLLHNPDRDLAAMARSGQVDVKRVAWVIDNLRPLRASQRKSLVGAVPTWMPAPP